MTGSAAQIISNVQPDGPAAVPRWWADTIPTTACSCSRVSYSAGSVASDSCPGPPLFHGGRSVSDADNAQSVQPAAARRTGAGAPALRCARCLPPPQHPPVAIRLLSGSPSPPLLHPSGGSGCTQSRCVRALRIPAPPAAHPHAHLHHVRLRTRRASCGLPRCRPLPTAAGRLVAAACEAAAVLVPPAWLARQPQLHAARGDPEAPQVAWGRCRRSLQVRSHVP